MSELTVFLVDDDAGVRDALGLLLGIHGYRIALFASSEDFLKAWRKEWSGCLVLDIRMGGMDGLALQEHLAQLGCVLPIIIITGHGDVGLARQAFKAKATDFLEKPIVESKLIEAIELAFADARRTISTRASRAEVQARLPGLTPREREVMRLVVAGKHNRHIALTLGISPRTVEVHKANLMAKLAVDSVAELVRMSMLFEPED